MSFVVVLVESFLIAQSLLGVYLSLLLFSLPLSVVVVLVVLDEYPKATQTLTRLARTINNRLMPSSKRVHSLGSMFSLVLDTNYMNWKGWPQPHACCTPARNRTNAHTQSSGEPLAR